MSAPVDRISGGAAGLLSAAAAILFAAGVLVCATLPLDGRAMAQSLDDSFSPGRVEQRFQQPLRPLAVPDLAIPKAEEQLPPQQAAQIRFRLGGVRVTGASVYAESDFLPFYRDLLGSEVDLNRIYDIADAIGAKYRNDGYVLTRVIVPPQRISEGIVTLQVVEGYVDKIEIEGDVPQEGGLIDIYARRILASRPLNAKDLERSLLLMNDLAGVTAKAVMIPSFDTPGASDLILQLRFSRADGFATVDNRGTRFIGPNQMQAGAGVNSLLGNYTRIEARGVITQQSEELRYGEVAATVPVDSHGTLLTGRFNANATKPGDSLQPFNVKGESQSLTIGLSHPWIRSRRENLTLKGGYTYRYSKTDILGQMFAKDSNRILRAGAAYDFADGWNGVNLLELTLSQGLACCGARDAGAQGLGRVNAKPDFSFARLDLVRVQAIDAEVRVNFGASGQYALAQLPSAEQFGYGGELYGRAFDPSALTGDHGVAAKAEAVFQPQIKSDLLQDYQLFAYADYGAVFRIDALGAASQAQGASLGVGLRLRIADRISGSLEMAQPLMRNTAKGNRNPRAFFRFGVQF